ALFREKRWPDALPDLEEAARKDPLSWRYNWLRQQAASLAGRSTLAETEAIPQINSGRADIILAGAIILEEFMKRHQLPQLMVSTRGVRYGVMLREMRGEEK
ncbi:MAG: hypothetical protein DYG96_03375, partial [Chlorobi bacterium CHB2]|nr:hypothetical protein [Chlorobi bacterium CHB2]